MNGFHYEVKAPDRTFWHFRGFPDDKVDEIDDNVCWHVSVTQESNGEGIDFEMYTRLGRVPDIMEVFVSFQSTVTGLLGPIAAEIHYKRNSGMI